MKTNPFNEPLDSANDILPDFNDWFVQKWNELICFNAPIIETIIIALMAIIASIYLYRWLFKQEWYYRIIEYCEKRIHPIWYMFIWVFWLSILIYCFVGPALLSLFGAAQIYYAIEYTGLLINSHASNHPVALIIVAIVILAIVGFTLTWLIKLGKQHK